MAALPYNDRVEAFCRRLTDRRIDGSLAAAKGTAELLRQLVTSSRLNTPEALLTEVKRVGLRMQAAKPIGASLRCALIDARSVLGGQRSATATTATATATACNVSTFPRPRLKSW